MPVPQEFLQAFEAARPEACGKCKHLESAAKASYEQAVSQGAGPESATAAGLAIIDPDCQGMKEPENDDAGCIGNTVCGAPEKVCGRKEGPRFLLNHAYGIRIKLIEAEPL